MKIQKTDLIDRVLYREECETIAHSTDPFAPVAYLKFNKLRLLDKVGFVGMIDRTNYVHRYLWNTKFIVRW